MALALVTRGCGATGRAAAPAPAVETRTFTGDNGEVTIPAHPQRVVATGYAVPALIEAGAPLVGISTWARGVPMMSPDELATYEGLPKVAGESAADTDYEAIALAKPDLIVIGVPAPLLAEVDVERLSTLAPVVAVGPTIPSAWREISRRHAAAAGALTGFDAARSAYEAKAAELKAKYAGVVPQLRFGHVGLYGQITDGRSPTARSTASSTGRGARTWRRTSARTTTVVLRTAWLTQALVRLTLGGPGIGGFRSHAPEEHVRLIFPDEGGELRLPERDGNMLRWPRPMPISREYTVRRHDPASGELDVDVAVHPGGVASDWAVAVEPGERIHVAGPPGGFVVPGHYDRYLLAGDLTALPQIARYLEELPRARRGGGDRAGRPARVHRALGASR